MLYQKLTETSIIISHVQVVLGNILLFEFSLRKSESYFFTKRWDPLHLRQDKNILDLVYMHPGGVRNDTHLFYFEKSANLKHPNVQAVVFGVSHLWSNGDQAVSRQSVGQPFKFCQANISIFASQIFQFLRVRYFRFCQSNISDSASQIFQILNFDKLGCNTMTRNSLGATRTGPQFENLTESQSDMGQC